MPKKPKTADTKKAGRQIVPGISMSRRNEATVAPELSDVLFDLALKLEETTNMAVDVQHVLAAVVMGAQTGEISSTKTLQSDDPELLKPLTKYVRIIFENFDGKVGQDD